MKFGLQRQGQKLLALLLNITDVHSLGTQAVRGMITTEGFYWDMDDASRAFSKRFLEKEGYMPTTIQAGVYSAVMHYLKVIDAPVKLDEIVWARKAADVCGQSTINASLHVRSSRAITPTIRGSRAWRPRLVPKAWPTQSAGGYGRPIRNRFWR